MILELQCWKDLCGASIPSQGGTVGDATPNLCSTARDLNHRVVTPSVALFLKLMRCDPSSPLQSKPWQQNCALTESSQNLLHRQPHKQHIDVIRWCICCGASNIALRWAPICFCTGWDQILNNWSSVLSGICLLAWTYWKSTVRLGTAAKICIANGINVKVQSWKTRLLMFRELLKWQS